MRTPISRLWIVCVLAALALGGPAEAALRLPDVIGDHMVLQRDAETRIWGWADPGETVTVRVGVHEVSGTADGDGAWSVQLPAPAGGGSLEMLVSAGGESITVRDVLVGEVWICSGQSNMQWPLSQATDAEEEIAEANYPLIRLFTVSMNTAKEPLEDCTGEWALCTPETAGPFSAVGYFFGRKIHGEEGVPVGLINTSWGGTPAEAWTSRGALDADADLKKMYGAEEGGDDVQKADRARFDAKLEAGGSAPVTTDLTSLAGTWDFISGVPGQEIQSAMTVSLEGDELDVAMVGWTAEKSTEVSYAEGELKWTFLIPGYSPLPLHCAVTVRGGAFRGTISVGDSPGGPFVGAKRGSGVDRVDRLVPSAPQNRPTSLYNAMIAPLLPFPIRGAIWYQGEANANTSEDALLYHKLFSTMIGDWRAAWGQGDFPFLYVQLANFKERYPDPQPHSPWAELRDSQRLTLSTPNTGMAVIIDIGEGDNIHPKNKQDVGKRLALAALAKAYGKDVAYSGPMYRSFSVEGGRVRIAFDHTNDGLATRGGDHLVGFSIAGEDRRFVWAEASIEGDAVVVWSDEVAKPAAVRYAWADNPACNLYNGAGLPASPFRTDPWRDAP